MPLKRTMRQWQTSLATCWSLALQCISEKPTADQFAESFRTQIDNIRTAIASADPPVIVTRQVPPLSCFKPATVPEILHLLKKRQPSRASWIPFQHGYGYSSSLHRTSHLPSVICVICPWKVAFFQHNSKHARVRPLPYWRNQPWTPMIPFPTHIGLSPTFVIYPSLLNVSLLTG